MQQFKKKMGRGLVEASQVSEETYAEIATWTGGFVVDEVDPDTGEIMHGINVPCMIGNQRASTDMWVVFTGGHFHVLMPSAFESWYEPVEPTEEPRIPIQRKGNYPKEI